jgi:hypothetical protein
MSAGGEPMVQVDGSVLRRIHKNFYKEGLELPIQLEAFRPTKDDLDGLSVFLAAEATPEQTLAVVPPAKRPLYYVASIPIQDLRQLGLTLLPHPIEEAPGHAVIPEMNLETYNRDKAAGKELQKKLAEIASRNIVLRPAPPS